jgi:AraC family transcriptional regulator
MPGKKELSLTGQLGGVMQESAKAALSYVRTKADELGIEKNFFESTTEIPSEEWIEHADALVSIKNRRIEMTMQEIYAEVVQPGFAHDLLIEASGTMVLVEIARHGQRLRRATAKSGRSEGLTPWQMRRIHERIQASLEMGYPSLTELSRLCRISQSHLMRNFKASTGWQLHKYIAEERLRAAKRMLSENLLSSKEISARLGFRSPEYFATAFRRMTGITPMDFRRRVRMSDVGSA